MDANATHHDAFETQEQADDRMITAAFEHLKATYLNSNHRKKIDIITRAYNFARQAHKGVRRRSGEPYILHPIAVAQVCCEEMGMGSTTICAALLHDVVEDTDYTSEDIANLFGHKVANIVTGVTKISGGIFVERASLQAESFKKLLLTMSDDIRVILVKLADRVHNMRTLGSMPPSKRHRITGETLFIFAPIAERLGLNKIKSELELLSFKYEHPEAYEAITQKLAATEAQRIELFEEFIAPIRKMLDTQGVEYTIKARIKSPYSIWQKMQKKNLAFEEVYDILATRIIFKPKKREEEINECFNIYVGLSQIYKTHPDRTRDWLIQPKANGYQALHVTLMSHRGSWIEVQIRSDRMDDIAEQGFAAHWKYKGNNTIPKEDEELNKWLNSIREILDDPQPDTLDFLDTFKLNLFASEILVFTPKGDIKTLPTGATVLDFAFTIHSFIGSHCMGAKVNHRLVPISHVLSSGDQVEVITSQQQHVKREWLAYVTTAKAKGKIQAILRRNDREMRHKGEAILIEFLQAHDMMYSPVMVERLCHFAHSPSRDALLTAIGNGTLQLTQVLADKLAGKYTRRGWLRYVPFLGRSDADRTATTNIPEHDDAAHHFFHNIDRKKGITLTETNLPYCEIAPCCRPIAGDETLAYLTDEERIILHKRGCDEAMRLKNKFGSKLVAVTWEMHGKSEFDATIYIKGLDSRGILSQVIDVLSRDMQVFIKKVNLESNNGIFEGELMLGVRDTQHVIDTCNAVKAIAGIDVAIRLV
ncbi:MAG: RelA/SpoT family protein [Bacteroidales bacterium]|nr:RelA/SpoT family protein [Bacteroidales bacterium]